jgi:hypothetical protein
MFIASKFAVLFCLFFWLLNKGCLGVVASWSSVEERRSWATVGLDLVKNYSVETAVIVEGQREHAISLAATGSNPRKELLCVTFLKATSRISALLLSNIKNMSTNCDWALVLYNGTAAEISRLCSYPVIEKHAVYCKRNLRTYERHPLIQNKKINVSVPKNILYADLLPLLPLYNNVFLMDEDISLANFNITLFMAHWKCSFNPPPLIVQPLVFESTQFFKFLSLPAWKEARPNVYASTVMLVEQQAPLLNAEFFAWFVRYVLAETNEVALVRGSDWGHDQTWCGAARAYATQVLGQKHIIAPCAVFPKAPNVNHLNLRTLASKNTRGFRPLFNYNGFFMVNNVYQVLFPNWVITGVNANYNPLNRLNATFLPSVSTPNQCMEDAKIVA